MNSKIELDKKSFIPLYFQVKEHLKKDIISKKLKSKMQILPEPELAKKYSVSRMTARRAITELIKEGLVVRQKGKGTFVADLSSYSNLKRKNGSIALIIPYINDAFTSDIIRGIEHTVNNKKDYSLIFCNSNGDCKKEEESIQRLVGEVNGFIIFPVDSYSNLPVFLMLNKRKIPFVLIDKYLKDLKTDYVGTNNFKGAYEITKHLIKLGHKRIAHITALNPERRTSENDRLEGYKKAICDNQIKFNEELVKKLDFSTHLFPIDCKRQIDDLLQIKDRPTAIFCIHDLVAVAVIKVLLEEKGLRVPDNITVVGFDNIPIAEVIGLSTVFQQRYELGEKAAKLLMDKIKGKRKRLCHIVLEPELIVRRSSGAKLR